MQDPRLSPQYLRSIGQDPKDLPFYKTVMCNYWRSTVTGPGFLIDAEKALCSG